MIRTTQCLLRLAMLALLAGCLPSTKVYKDPGENDRGVRFYRPKPYLLVKPMVNRAGDPVDGYVSIETVMLPDFGEEYSIHVRSGLGTNDTKITLADGWRLDGLNVDLDSSTDENLEAMADLVKLVPTLTSGADETGKMSVRATNVPLGYYESVLSRGHDCKKRLYGFRYVGFLPYASCPLESSGWEPTDCFSGDIYSLVFEDNAMVFRPLHAVATAEAAAPEAVPAEEVAPTAASPTAASQDPSSTKVRGES